QRLFHNETRWFTDKPRCAEVKQEADERQRLFHNETRWFTDEPRCAEVKQEADKNGSALASSSLCL
ncbi:hypothetical protein, partial [Paenibacillus alkalitolerans]|uniref:hypothetical protein n=1 Tax=Paenibacillus alkalitolerans TaxID=2799335 RepID=UPI001F163B90